jgi:hypothetical protein
MNCLYVPSQVYRTACKHCAQYYIVVVPVQVFAFCVTSELEMKVKASSASCEL